MPVKKKKQMEESSDPVEKLRLKLLKEEFALRKNQPKSWIKTKYRKSIVKIPRDDVAKPKKKKKTQKE